MAKRLAGLIKKESMNVSPTILKSINEKFVFKLNHLLPTTESSASDEASPTIFAATTE